VSTEPLLQLVESSIAVQ